MNAQVAAGLVNWLCESLAERYGLDLDRTLANLGLDERRLSDPDALVEMAALIAIFRFARERTGDPALGLRLASLPDLRQQGFWGYALLSSGSMRERLQGHVRYQRLRSPVGLQLSEDEGIATLHVIPHGIADDVLGTMMDWAMATTLMQLRSQLGSASREIQVWLSYPAAAHHRDLVAMFGGQVIFEAPCICLRFPARLLDRTLQGDPYLGRLARGQLDAQLQRVRAPVPGWLVDQVRERIALRLDHDASLGRVARDLGLSARTLQRQLDAQASSFNALVEEVRRTHALRCVGAPGQSIEHIAGRLGYADAASFRRAFRRWTGQSPAQYRASQRVMGERVTGKPATGEAVAPLSPDARTTARKVSRA